MVEHLEEMAGRIPHDEGVDFFTKLLNNPENPFVAVLGGAKVAEKVGVIRNMLDRVDTLIIGGAMPTRFGSRGAKLRIQG
jgi:phosphoglycerate kinase